MKEQSILHNLLLGFVTAQQFLPFTANAKKNRILHVGDSYAYRLGQTLEKYCKGSEVVNAGIGGTTAEQWSQWEQKDIFMNSCKDEDMNFDEVYISVGGNDFNGSGCTLSHEELTTRMEDAIHNIVYNIAPGAKTYVVMGYCITPEPVVRGNVPPELQHCTEPGAAHPIDPTKTPLKVDMPPGSVLDVYDSAYACGGTETSGGDPKYFKDSQHPNAMGFCKIFTESSDVQDSFRCEKQPPLDCDDLNFELYGYDEVCELRGEESAPKSGGGGGGGGLGKQHDDKHTSKKVLEKKKFMHLIGFVFVALALIFIVKKFRQRRRRAEGYAKTHRQELELIVD